MKNMKIELRILYLVSIVLILGGCRSYTSNVLLKAEPEDGNWKSEYKQTVINYPIKVADKIQFTLYTNLGEAIIDPSGKLVPISALGESNTITEEKESFEVSESGFCRFPVIGKLKVEGLTVSQLDSLLSTRFEEYYNDVFVMSKVANKRVIILGGTVGGRIIPYVNPNMTLLEALALYGGIDHKSKGYNIRVIRGDLQNPEFTVVNLRSMSDMKSTVISIKPNDIIYIEPVRRPFNESVQDNLFIVNLLNLLVTFSILLSSLAN